MIEKLSKNIGLYNVEMLKCGLLPHASTFNPFQNLPPDQPNTGCQAAREGLHKQMHRRYQSAEFCKLKKART
jgi:hypothetical protein